MSDLRPCPFCAAGEHRFDKSTHWTGMRSVTLSVTLVHWCEPPPGYQVDRAIIKITRKTEEECVDAWNNRIERGGKGGGDE